MKTFEKDIGDGFPFPWVQRRENEEKNMFWTTHKLSSLHHSAEKRAATGTELVDRVALGVQKDVSEQHLEILYFTLDGLPENSF